MTLAHQCPRWLFMGSRRIRPKKMISSHISKHELVDFPVGACSTLPPEEFQLLVYDSVAHAYRSPDPNAANGLHIGVPMFRLLHT